MDVSTLISQAKARFNHNSAKEYLKQKYNSKLLIAEQGGLWRADQQTIGFLSGIDNEYLVLLDTYDNPVKVNRQELLNKLKSVYASNMEEYYREYKELETKR